jgi:hypothetical protein
VVLHTCLIGQETANSVIFVNTSHFLIDYSSVQGVARVDEEQRGYANSSEGREEHVQCANGEHDM